MNLRKTAMIGLVAMSVGCVFPESPNNKGWKLGEDAGDSGARDTGGGDVGGGDVGGTDMGTSDTGGRDVGPSGKEVQFRMINNSSTPVFAYQGVGGAGSCFDGAWLEVFEGGEARRVTSDCTRCHCDDAPDCVTCAIDCAPGADPDYSQLSVGGVRTYNWNGLLRDDTTKDGVACEFERPPTSGELTARFCWGTSFAATFDPWGEITDVQCEDVQFSADQGVVEFEIPESAPREPINFVMSNETPDILYAHYSAGGPCSFGSWLELSNRSQTIDYLEDCGTCSCADLANNPDACSELCPAIACAQPTREAFEFLPGTRREFQWNRVGYLRDTVDNAMCERDYLVTGVTSATFCWGREIDDSLQILDEECEVIDFDPQAETDVQFLVGSQP